MSSYQPGIPTGTVNLDVDYLNIQNNFQQLDTSFGVDHVTFSNQTAQNGYHQSIHFNPVSTTATNPPNNQPVIAPATTGGFGQLFSAQINDGINADEALYFLTGGNRLTQMTRNFQPTIAANTGTTFIPGGFILKFGRVTASANTTGTVNLNTNGISFPNACFSVWTQPFYTGANPSGVATAAIKINTPTSFTWTFITSSGAYTGFLWVALGN